MACRIEGSAEWQQVSLELTFWQRYAEIVIFSYINKLIGQFDQYNN